jgi:uncharacterized protein (TIGR03663 family)
LIAAVLAFALALRLVGLNDRPFHTDEANNAFILQELFDGHYRYRTHDHHGPTLYYVGAAVLAPLGLRELSRLEPWMLRLLPLTAGLLLAATPFLFRRWLGGLPGALAASTCLLLASPFAYYGGIFIHELLLLLLLSAFLAALWRLRDTGGVREALFAGLFAGLAVSTKETAAPVLLLLCAVAWPGSPLSLRAGLRAALLAAAAALLVVALVFSGFGAHPSRALDLFSAIGRQVGRGLGSEHAYPWHTYLSWMAAPGSLGVPWSGWLLPAAAACGAWFLRRESFPRTLLLWAACLFVFFSALSYKTPWLMLVWLLPLSLLAGAAFSLLYKRERLIASLALLGAAALLGSESWSRCVDHPVDAGNPLAYSPTSPDLDRLSKDLDALAALLPEGRATLVQVIAGDYWPLPWTLRRFSQTGYWETFIQPEPGAIVLAGPEHARRLASLGRTPRPYSLRPGILIYLCPPNTHSEKQ